MSGLTSSLRSFFVVGGFILLAAAMSKAAGIDSPDSWKTGREELSRLGSGYLVWESNRTGNWRIWKINLDGSGLRQLSPLEKGREHYCPHISPDGKTIVYLSYPDKWWSYDSPKNQKIPLRLMKSDGSGDRVLVEDARMFGEDRAAVWLNNHELVYIGGDRMTYRLDINSGKSTPLLKQAAQGDNWGYGYLVNATLNCATTGVPNFSVFDSQTQTISARKTQDGCQPYFSRDGVWGFWMGGGGGPINRIHLASGQVSPIIKKDDERMPRERNYLYFPMLSPCGRLFAFGASPAQHDHFNSDYDIFVSRINPKTLELIGKPVRYTFDKGCDRFPDVFLADLELGEQRGEAPYTLEIANDKVKGEAEWHFGDGTILKSLTGKHTYTKPGEYEVEARQGERVLRGRVQVAQTQAPRALSAIARAEREILVRFDEPVRLQNPTVSLSSKTKVEKWQLDSDGQSLTVVLGKKLPGEDTLLLDGIYDKAQKPNKIATNRLTVKPLSWPVSRERLAFLWENSKKPNLIADVSTKSERSFALKACDEAYFNRDFGMRIANGAFLVEGADDNLLAACKQSNQLTIEATILPENLKQQGPARIISFSSDTSTRNFTLGQQDDKLVLRLRTPQTGLSGTNPQVDLCTLSTTEPNHIIVTYSPGKLTCYRNGQEVLKSDLVKGDFSNWTPQHLLFGDEWGGGRRWNGTLEGIALYSRALTSDEARTSYEQQKNMRMARKPVAQLEVQAKLVGRSKTPTLKEIQPYRQALVTYEYEVEKVLSGKYQPKKIRVAHWGLLDGKELPITQVKQGTSTRLLLEPFSENKQLESIYLSDTLEENFDLEPYFSVGR